MKRLIERIIDSIKYKKVQFDTSESYDIVEIGHFKHGLTFDKDTSVLIHDVRVGDSYEELHLIAEFILDDKHCEINMFEHTTFKIIN